MFLHIVFCSGTQITQIYCSLARFKKKDATDAQMDLLYLCAFASLREFPFAYSV